MTSFTSTRLYGSVERPDFVTYWYPKSGKDSNNDTSFEGNVYSQRLNNLGYVPVISTVSEGYRGVISIIHIIQNLVKYLFASKENKEVYFKEIKFGAKNLARSLVGIFPIVGNIALFIYDRNRVNQIKTDTKKEILEHLNKHGNQSLYANKIAIFADGKLVAIEFPRPYTKMSNDVYERQVGKYQIPANERYGGHKPTHESNLLVETHNSLIVAAQ